MERIKSIAKPVQGREDIAAIATISAADPQIGNLIADVMEKVGKDGVITVEESRGLSFETEYVEGMEFDRGYISAYFVTNAERMVAEVEDPVRPPPRRPRRPSRGRRCSRARTRR